MSRALYRDAVVVVMILTGGCANASVTETLAVSSTTTSSTAAPVTTSTTSPPISTTLDPNTPTTTTVPVPPPTSTPPLPTTTTTPPPPVFEYTIEPVTGETVSLTWREDCPLHYSELSLLTLTYWNFDGRAVSGEMVVNNTVVDDVITTFERLFDIGFPIEEMALVDDYGGDDKRAMAANVTASFNCRYVDGTERWSNHAFGLAIDINPLINPWAREGNVLPLEGTGYTSRADPVPGMINPGDPIIDVFADVGWSWGGAWTPADYMHFSQPGN